MGGFSFTNTPIRCSDRSKNVHLRYATSFQAEAPETTISPRAGNPNTPSTREAKVERQESLPVKQRSSRQDNVGSIV